jgi:hypothetical protein
MESVSREKQIPGSESDELKAVASDLGVDPETLYNRVLDRVMED